MHRSIQIKDVFLGKADGSNESNLADFEKYYCDNQGYVSEIQSPDKFLILGRKGTGKTLLTRYIKKISLDNPLQFVEIKSLRDFQFAEIQQFRIDNNTYSEYLPLMEWIILIHLSELIVRDNSIQNTTLQDTLRKFLEINFNLKINDEKVIEKTRKQELKGTVSILSGGVESEVTRGRGNYLEYLNDLRETVLELLSDSKCNYLVFYDELDDRFSLSDLYKESIQSLIKAVAKLNNQFLEGLINAKVILVMRTDVFFTLNSPNLNKYSLDNSVTLDWVGSNERYSPLLEMILLKMKNSIKKLIPEYETYDTDRIFNEFFSEHVDGTEMPTYLLDMGLRRPRDVIQMLIFVQKAYPVVGKFDYFGFRETKKQYSEYFLHEIQNEMSGHLTNEEINVSFSILRSVKKPTFNFNSLFQKLEFYPAIKDREHLIKLLKELFRFSAIGNVIQDEKNKKTHYTWAHLDVGAEPDFTANFSIHYGLRMALKAESQ